MKKEKMAPEVLKYCELLGHPLPENKRQHRLVQKNAKLFFEFEKVFNDILDGEVPQPRGLLKRMYNDAPNHFQNN